GRGGRRRVGEGAPVVDPPRRRALRHPPPLLNRVSFHLFLLPTVLIPDPTEGICGPSPSSRRAGTPATCSRRRPPPPVRVRRAGSPRSARAPAPRRAHGPVRGSCGRRTRSPSAFHAPLPRQAPGR